MRRGIASPLLLLVAAAIVLSDEHAAHAQIIHPKYNGFPNDPNPSVAQDPPEPATRELVQKAVDEVDADRKDLDDRSRGAYVRPHAGVSAMFAANPERTPDPVLQRISEEDWEKKYGASRPHVIDEKEKYLAMREEEAKKRNDAVQAKQQQRQEARKADVAKSKKEWEEAMNEKDSQDLDKQTKFKKLDRRPQPEKEKQWRALAHNKHAELLGKVYAKNAGEQPSKETLQAQEERERVKDAAPGPARKNSKYSLHPGKFDEFAAPKAENLPTTQPTDQSKTERVQEQKKKIQQSDAVAAGNAAVDPAQNGGVRKPKKDEMLGSAGLVGAEGVKSDPKLGVVVNEAQDKDNSLRGGKR